MLFIIVVLLLMDAVKGIDESKGYDIEIIVFKNIYKTFIKNNLLALRASLQKVNYTQIKLIAFKLKINAFD